MHPSRRAHSFATRSLAALAGSLALLLAVPAYQKARMGKKHPKKG